MTPYLIALTVVALSSAVGGLIAFVVIQRSKSRWVLAGQHQAELAHGTWSPAVSGDGWNSADVPDRRRSPNRQLVTRATPDRTPRLAAPR
ncbi:hypothetical protein [Actinoplanes sp. NPDC051494]|uniref:hypothetical protein n=1 Tax=Actinoplanes sp. NPDC051494 TaxID=3363907 RepID=UPI0037AF1116